MFPNGLVGRPHRGAHICQRWELRVTERCLVDDLDRPGDSKFEDLTGIDIVKELINGRSDRTEDRNEISPLTSGVPVWVLSRGHDHRGATFYDEDANVVWLLAYGRHRSGEANDFFPFCTELDEKDRLLPTDADYERMFDDRGHRFVDGVLIEAPLALKQARENPGEHRLLLGGEMGAAVAVEIEVEAEATTIAFRKETLDWDQVPLVLAAFHAEAAGTWESTDRLPSRSLEDGEMAFIHVHESGT